MSLRCYNQVALLRWRVLRRAISFISFSFNRKRSINNAADPYARALPKVESQFSDNKNRSSAEVTR
jgi:hypothetical protein